MKNQSINAEKGRNPWVGLRINPGCFPPSMLGFPVNFPLNVGSKTSACLKTEALMKDPNASINLGINQLMGTNVYISPHLKPLMIPLGW